LDAGVRAELRGEIGRVARELRATTIYVTHDQVEAMTMADRVGVLRRGRLQQVGTPHDVYESPETVFVAAFLGTPRINLFQGAVYGQPGGGVVVDLGTQVVAIPADDPLATVLSGHINDRVTVGLRPDSLYPAPIDEPGGLRGRVRLVEHLGHEVLVHVDTDSVPPAPQTIGLDLPDAEHLARLIPRQRRPQPAPATRTEYGFYPSYQAVEPVDSGDLVVRLPAPDAPRVGQSVALTVDVHRMLLFDPAGVRIRLR
jgi:multiple sugar transport system ATP-binding protein